MLKRDTVRCGRCQRIGHTARKCHALLCSYCDKTGHLESDCSTLLRDIENGREAVLQIMQYPMFPKEDTKRKSQGQRRENKTIARARSNANVNIKEINESTIGYYRKKLIAPYKNILEIKAPELKRKKAKMLFDAASSVTMIKIGKLLNKTPAEKETLTLESAFGKRIQTICLVQLNIQVGNEVVTQPCRVVHNDFFLETDGVLGWDFIKKSKMNTNSTELDGVKLPCVTNKSVRATQQDNAGSVFGA